MMNRVTWNAIVLAVLLVIGVGIYSNSLHNGFHYDDSHHIVKNKYLTTLRNTPLFFKEGRTFSDDPDMQNHYRPLLLTSYALNYFFGRLNPSGYHIVNLAFHIGSAFLIFLIVQAMLIPALIPLFPPLVKGDEGGFGEVGGLKGSSVLFAALAAGLIFLTTPFNSEVVNYIAARSSVMCTFFYLFSFYCWVKYRSTPSLYFYLASLLVFLLAMLTKEIAVTLPLMIFLYDRYFPREDAIPAQAGVQNPGRGLDSHLRGNDGHFSNLRSYLTYIPFAFVAGFIGFFLRKALFGNILSKGNGPERDMAPHLLTASWSMLKYIYMTLFPSGLSIEHPAALSISLWDPPILFALA